MVIKFILNSKKNLKRNFSTLSYLDLSYDEIKIDIERAHKSILKICDQIPRIFRTPHFGEYSENSKNNLIYNILKDLDYFYSSSTTPIYSIIHSPLFTQNNIIEMPSSAYIDKPLQIIDSWSMIDKSIDFNFLFNQLKKMYLLMESTNILFNIYFDPSDIINSDNFFNELSKFNKFQNQIEKKEVAVVKQKLNGLVITYCYPPYESPESLVTFKLVNSIGTRSNITILRPNFLEQRKKIFNFKNKNINEIKVDIPKYIQKILEIKRLPIRPDRFLFFYPFFIRKLKKMNINKFDFFMTRSQFHTSHLLGLYLKKNYNLPWYAHFSDPWYNNPVQKRIPLFDTLSLRMQQK